MARNVLDSCVDLLCIAFCCYACQQLTRPKVVVVEKQNTSEKGETSLEAVGSQIMQRERVEIVASNGAVLPLLTIYPSQ
jgi:hypothetical protein